MSMPCMITLLSFHWWLACRDPVALDGVDDARLPVPRAGRVIPDRHFPQGRLVLAILRGRQLPVIAHAFAQHVLMALRGA